LYTRCQACHTVHPVNAAILAQGGGKYRCGKCQKISNALESLFDEWPQAKQQAPRQGNLPQLGLNLSITPDTRSATVPEEHEPVIDSTGAENSGLAAGWPGHRILWIGAATVLIIFISLNLLTFFRQPLPNLSRLESTLVRLGVKKAPPEPAFRAPGPIELLSRALKTHPSRPGALLLTATIVNRSDKTQPYPDIGITLLDIHGRQLAHRVFEPKEYLAHAPEQQEGMVPQAYLPLSLEMPDPGSGAVGFELQFH